MKKQGHLWLVTEEDERPSKVLFFNPTHEGRFRRFFSWLFGLFKKRPGSIVSVCAHRRLRSYRADEPDPDDAA